MAAAEKLLMEAWQLCQSSPLTLDQKAQPMGRYLTRVALFLLGKGAKGPEAKVYKQLEEITDIFTAEMMSMGKYGKMDVTEPAAPSSASAQQASVPCGLEARGCPKCLGLVWCKHATILPGYCRPSQNCTGQLEEP